MNVELMKALQLQKKRNLMNLTETKWADENELFPIDSNH